jgi:hypothetical protein
VECGEVTMAVYESSRYRDPLEAMIRNEEKTCKGCRFEGWVEVGEKRIKVCKIRKTTVAGANNTRSGNEKAK